MVDKIGDKGKKGKVGGIKETQTSKQVEKTEQVGRIGKIKESSAVGKVGKAGRSQGPVPGEVLTPADRDPLYRLIDEETEKILGATGDISDEQREAIANAVKMAVDAAIVNEDDEEGEEEEG